MQIRRLFSSLTRPLSGEVAKNPAAGSNPNSQGPNASPKHPGVLEQARMSPTALDRIFLTWSGQFKNKAEVPASLPGDVVMRARSFARIRINIGFLLLTVAACGIAIKMGREDVRQGLSVEKINLDWHKKVNEEHRQASNGK